MLGDDYELPYESKNNDGNKGILDEKIAGRVADFVDAGSFFASLRARNPGCAVLVLFSAVIRREGIKSAYPTSILGGKYSITSVRDLTTGYDNTKPGNKAVLPISKSSQMITFTFDNGLVTTLRTSGTEPKIKYYNELCASPDQKDLKELKNVLNEMVSAIVSEFLQPEVNKLIARNS